MERFLGMQRIVENWRTFIAEEKMADLDAEQMEGRLEAAKHPPGGTAPWRSEPGRWLR